MSYQVEQKIGKHVYLYEVQSYWDRGKQQARQKRRYLGKKDIRTGIAITPRSGFTPRMARDYGNFYLLQAMAEKIGLKSILEQTFSEIGSALLNLAYFEISERKPLYLFKPWSEGTAVPDVGDLSSQATSRLMADLGKMEQERDRFLSRWVQSQKDVKAVVYDITSLSTYSESLDFAEWGYNRNGESLPQVNLGVVFGQPSELPLRYHLYPGSIQDVSTFKNLLVWMKPFAFQQVMLVLDRGFYSASNLNEMKNEGVRFVMPLPFKVREAGALLTKTEKALRSPLNAFSLEGATLFHVAHGIQLAGRRLQAHVYFDENRRASELNHLMQRVTAAEQYFEEKTIKTRRRAHVSLAQNFPGLEKFFDLKIRRGKVHLMRHEANFEARMDRMGRMILLTNDFELSASDLLLLYRRKDELEKLFDIMKNELREERIRVGSREAMEGRLFLYYLSLILYAALSKVMKTKNLYKTYSLSEVLQELKKLRMVTLSNGKSYLTELSKQQRFFFEQFEIPIPI